MNEILENSNYNVYAEEMEDLEKIEIYDDDYCFLK